MKNACPEEYNIFPQTWVLPAGWTQLFLFRIYVNKASLYKKNKNAITIFFIIFIS